MTLSHCHSDIAMRQPRDTVILLCNDIVMCQPHDTVIRAWNLSRILAEMKIENHGKK